MKVRLYFFDNIKFILMMFVILHHCSMPFIYMNEATWVVTLYVLIMPFTMSTFTMISGCFYKKRSFTHLLTYLLLPCILVSICNFILGNYSPINYISERPYTCLGYAMWYLWVLFVYNLVTPYLLKFINIRMLIALTFIACLVLLPMSFMKDSNLQISRLLSHYVFFLVGILLKDYDFNRLKQKYAKYSGVLFVVLYVINICICLYKPSWSWIPAFATPRPLIMEMYGLLICTFMSILIILWAPNKNCIITNLGKNTLYPYLFHMLLILPICWTLGLKYTNTTFGYILYMLIVPSCCLVFFTDWLKKIVNRFCEPVNSLIKKYI